MHRWSHNSQLDQVSLLGVDTLSLELLDGESSETIVEKIKLDPLLVEGCEKGPGHISIK
jgi:hypothetical protein